MDFELVGVGNRRSLAKARSTMLRMRSAANSVGRGLPNGQLREVVPVAGLGWRETLPRRVARQWDCPPPRSPPKSSLALSANRSSGKNVLMSALRRCASLNLRPQGGWLGGFKLFGTLEADEVFNDNVYATSNATGKQAAFIQLINPTLELKSDWTNHMLNAYAKGGFGFYSVDGARNNYQDISVGADRA